MPLENYSLRDRKKVQTKVDIIKEIIAQMESSNLEDINIKKLVKKINISEVTFYSYFKNKDRVLLYLLQLFSIELKYELNNVDSSMPHLYKLHAILQFIIDHMSRNPLLLNNVISFLSTKYEENYFIPISSMEKHLLFENKPGIEFTVSEPIESIIMSILDQAIAENELPQINKQSVVSLILLGIYGFPVVNSYLFEKNDKNQFIIYITEYMQMISKIIEMNLLPDFRFDKKQFYNIEFYNNALKEAQEVNK